MDLDRNARISDASGSTTADHIQMQQTTGDFDARGHVSTTRLPESNKSESAMLDKDEPTHGHGGPRDSANRNKQIHYIGNAVVWQSSNRIQGDKIDIDRDKKSLVADGQVTTEFLDKPKATTTWPPDRPCQTRAARLHHREGAAHGLYRPGPACDLYRRSGLLAPHLDGEERDSQGLPESRRLRRRFAHQSRAGRWQGRDRGVRSADHRQRVGNSEHAEYYTDEGKIILTGGEPKLNDSKRGNTKGDKLTYYTDDEPPDVDGAAGEKVQVKSHLRKKT